MPEAVLPADRRTLWAGLLILLAAAAAVLDGFHASLYVDDNYSFPFDGTVAHRIADALLLAGFIVLALVRRGGQRVSGDSFGARVALVAFAAFRPVNAIVLAATIDDLQTRSWAAIALRLVLLLLGAYAAVSIMRAAVIDRWARRLLVMAVGAQMLLSVLVTTPSLVLLQLGASLWLLWPLSLAALGAGLLVDGRRAPIRRGVEAIRAGW